MSNAGLNIAGHLPARARERPNQLAVVCPHGRDVAGRPSHTHFTYRQLDEDSSRIAHGLREIGVRPGDRTVLMTPPSLDFFSLVFALFRLGAIPVLVDPGMGLKSLGQCLQEAEPTTFVGIPKAHAARRLFGWAKKSLRTFVSVGGPRAWGGVPLTEVRKRAGANADYPPITIGADEPAAILFTSGGTGVPKGVVYSHAIFTGQVDALRALYQIEPGEIDLCTFPLFALFAPALGMTAIVPEMDASRPARVDPVKIFEAVNDFGVTNLFGSPALLNRVGRFGVANGLRLPTLRRVISAGAPVPATVMERMVAMLQPPAQVFTPYGATEALPVCSIGSDVLLSETRAKTDQGAGVCVGCPIPGVRLEIIPIRDEPIERWSEQLALPAGQVGEIVVQGPLVTRFYHQRPAATELAKITDPATGSFFHRMGDLGYRDEQGRVWFCGRKVHRVVTPKGTMYTIPCEAIFNTHPGVFRSALVGIAGAEGTEPAIVVELEAETPASQWPTIAKKLAELAQRFEHTRSLCHFLRHPRFPVDVRHNAKIFREQLAVWAAKQPRSKR